MSPKDAKIKSTDQRTEDIQISQTIDARGLFCPMPVYKARQAALEAKPGEIIELLADDPASEEDVTRWANRTGNTILKLEKSSGIFRFLIQKTDR
ncbi:MAG: sulfurtransferase TusA family protein [Promethearchaeota archaeon]